MRFTPAQLSEREIDLQREVRAFLSANNPPDPEFPRAFSNRFDREFSRKMAAAGFVGRQLPPEFGGHGSGPVDSFVIIEEMYAAQAPFFAHFVADRQTAPHVLHYGSAELREQILPKITAGEVAFAVGMSEPDAGSDLAAIRTRAERVDGGWSLSGTKIWSSFAHKADFITALCRTTPPGDDRHDGMSQLIVDLTSPGVTVRPIPMLDGSEKFNEVVFDEVFVPDHMVLGEPGQGWRQVTGELVHERASPDRYMTGVPILEDLAAHLADQDATPRQHVQVLGGLTARLWAVRAMTLSLARGRERGETGGAPVALAKDLATTLAQEIVESTRLLYDEEIDPDSDTTISARLAKATMQAPLATIAGGTNEILRTVAAKGLRGTAQRCASTGSLVDDTIIEVFGKHTEVERVVAAERCGWDERLWSICAEIGLPWLGVEEARGGSGGTLDDALRMIRWAGYFGVPLPLAESALLGSWLLAGAGLQLPDGPVTVAPGSDHDRIAVRAIGGKRVLDGVFHRVPWAARSERIAVLAEVDDTPMVLSLPTAAAVVTPGRNIAYEPRDRVEFTALELTPDIGRPAAPGHTPAGLRRRGALVRSIQIAGACLAASDLSIDYAGIRTAFGRPIGRFQAVQAHLVRAAADAELAALAGSLAGARMGTDLEAFSVAAAKAVSGRAGRLVAASAHQVHGAISMTQEYSLHLRTRRIWSWSHEYGTETWWAAEVGDAVLADEGEHRLWRTLTREPGTKVVR